MNKNNSNLSIVLKLIVNQLAISILGLMLSFTFSSNIFNGKSWLLLCASIFSACFYLFLVYYLMNELGQYDGVRISAGRMKYNLFKGMLLAFYANIVNLLLGMLALIGKMNIKGISIFQNMKDLSDIDFGPSWAVNIYNISNTISRFIQGMYTGIASVVFPGNVLVLLMMPVPAILVSFLAYNIGVRNNNSKFVTK